MCATAWLLLVYSTRSSRRIRLAQRLQEGLQGLAPEVVGRAAEE
eukprot:CAMPEP_0119320750 /NCGR_PEP_ID=MMETSP1333-20130426/53303_1 /TAXON_ID=418940 /ORGANISM="Scyphosphaera apsteinii, Strain RCC1455" /LENGTH=43 /DNA_ID= /DNA_START= /DNA_END= /DNA_ORIENTATION=